ncbi:PH domain-containing protein [Flammeovirga kamogawensis]|uniref:Bacterial Pleckstrin homology domain-containing protein n=1 Tax=Flammeovirga kamogawensis TaxID=373891 RepID=A0ABX8H318_9BACT|nr:PH domain-containing protein [Flammeovirga kamogawensis]MBB6460406.1 preprotein translocase subunit SecE [Flammeovirga kamogawensis]QWG10211.1 hypothetical protein KM029_21250 [Flammeovirga kamogawensis]TRX64664.1 hypothetical protein EO216_19180 [Flammeovirga kamogawensis]
MNDKFYSTSLDTLAKILTAFTISISVFVTYNSIINLMYYSTNLFSENLLHLFIIVVMVAFFAFCFLFAPKGYRVTDNKLIILRRGKNKSYQLEEIEKIITPTKSEMRNTIRTFGVGGFFGYFGKFSNKKYGKLTFYISQRKNYIIAFLKSGEKIVLSPDDLLLVNSLSLETA